MRSDIALEQNQEFNVKTVHQKDTGEEDAENQR